MSDSYLELPDPFSIAVRRDFRFDEPRPPWRDYEITPEQQEAEDPTFGMDAFNMYNQDTATDFASEPASRQTDLNVRLQELDQMRLGIESLAQTYSVLNESHMDSQRLRMQKLQQNFESAMTSCEELVNEMCEMSFSVNAWYMFYIILKHRSELDGRRWKRNAARFAARFAAQTAERKAALRDYFGKFQAHCKRPHAWTGILSRFLPVTRQSRRQRQSGKFQLKWKSLSGWLDVAFKFLPVTRRNCCQIRQSTWQDKLRRFQTKWNRLFAWRDTASQLLLVARKSTRQRQLRLFQMKRERFVAWSDAASKLLVLSRQTSRQKYLKGLQVKWKYLRAWSGIAMVAFKIRRFIHQSKLQRELNRFQAKQSLFCAWRDTSCKVLSVMRASARQRQMKQYQMLWKRRERWSNLRVLISYASGSARVKGWKFIIRWSMLLTKKKKEHHSISR